MPIEKPPPMTGPFTRSLCDRVEKLLSVIWARLGTNGLTGNGGLPPPDHKFLDLMGLAQRGEELRPERRGRKKKH